MHENETVPRHNCYQKNGCQDDDGVTARFTSADAMQCPPAVKSVVDACRSLRADALAIELPEQTIVVVVNAYDGTYAAAICEPDALLSSIVRGLQVRLYSGQCVESPGAYLPSSTVRSSPGRLGTTDRPGLRQTIRGNAGRKCRRGEIGRRIDARRPREHPIAAVFRHRRMHVTGESR